VLCVVNSKACSVQRTNLFSDTVYLLRVTDDWIVSSNESILFFDKFR